MKRMPIAEGSPPELKRRVCDICCGRTNCARTRRNDSTVGLNADRTRGQVLSLARPQTCPSGLPENLNTVSIKFGLEAHLPGQRGSRRDAFHGLCQRHFQRWAKPGWEKLTGR